MTDPSGRAPSPRLWGAGIVAIVVAVVGVVAFLLVERGDGDERVPVAGPAVTSSTIERVPPTATTTTTEAEVRAPASSTTLAPVPEPIAPPGEVNTLDAGALAHQLSLVEHVILDPTQPESRVEEAGRLQQLLLRRLDLDVALADQVIPLLAPDVRGSLEEFLVAGRSIGSLVGPQRSFPSSWRIVAPPPASEVRGYFDEAEAASGIPWRYFAAIATVETRMGRIQGDSSAGAQGPMQFLPSTWKVYGAGGDIRDFRDSVLAASRLLRANGAPGDMGKALFRYNPLEAYVLAVERLAQRVLDDERQFLALHQWQVLYKHVTGITLLPVGWPDVPGEIVAPPEG